MMEFVSWDDEIPNVWKVKKRKMLQTTNQILLTIINQHETPYLTIRISPASLSVSRYIYISYISLVHRIDRDFPVRITYESPISIRQRWGLTKLKMHRMFDCPSSVPQTWHNLEKTADYFLYGHWYRSENHQTQRSFFSSKPCLITRMVNFSSQ